MKKTIETRRSDETQTRTRKLTSRTNLTTKMLRHAMTSGPSTCLVPIDSTCRSPPSSLHALGEMQDCFLIHSKRLLGRLAATGSLERVPVRDRATQVIPRTMHVMRCPLCERQDNYRSSISGDIGFVLQDWRLEEHCRQKSSARKWSREVGQPVCEIS